MEMDDLVTRYSRSNNGEVRIPFVLIEFLSAAIYYNFTGNTGMTLQEWIEWLDKHPDRWIE